MPTRCLILLAPIAVLFAFGLVRLHCNLPVFSVWIAEDGLVEWVTFAGLAGLGVLALGRVPALDAASTRTTWIVLGLIFLFCAMEEISWGQRIFGWHSPEWFLRHNAQQETNVHNLVLGGVKVNRLVFGKILGITLGLYFLAAPLLHLRSPRARAFLDRHALPVPRAYQVALIAVAWTVSEAGRSISGKSGELQELAGVFVLAGVLLHPGNPAAMPPARIADRLAARVQSIAAALAARARGWLPPRLRFLALAILLLLSGFFLLRLAFAAAFEPPGLVGPVGPVLWDRGVTRFEVTGPGLVPAADLARAWILGLRFDLRIALLMLLPLALLGGFRRLDPARSAVARRGWLAYLTGVTAAVLLLYAADFGQYAYEGRRLNAALLDQMVETDIAAAMAWQTYPVLRSLAAIALATAGAAVLFARWLPADAAAFSGSRRRRIMVGVAAALLYLLGLHGQWSQYPLRWSNAYFSPNPYLSALASNPLQTLFDTLRSPRVPEDPVAACAAQALLAPHFSLAPCSAPPASFARFLQPAAGATRPNVVVVFLESFSAYKTGIMGNPLQPTPHFDALARSSLLFTRFYSSTRPTARSIFASLFGIPDVSPGRSASRNPDTVRQHTLVNAFAGYRKHYFIGGSASWGNIRGMLEHNVAGLQLHEGEYSDLPDNDVWGASDLHLFEDAHRVLAAEREPFLAFIQTSGNHRPYTIPEDNAGFRRTALPVDVQLAAGFEEPAAYDGMRFIDHALGRFLALAAGARYARNTVFAFYGDHGMPNRRFPPHEQQARQQHVPLVLHVPANPGLAGRRIDEVASDIDVLPTLAALAGIPHLNTALGRNLLEERPQASRFAFFSTGEARGLVDRDFFYGLDRAGHESLHRARADGSLDAENLALRDPERLRRMADLMHAMDQGAGWLLRHNPPREHAPPDPAGGRPGRH